MRTGLVIVAALALLVTGIFLGDSRRGRDSRRPLGHATGGPSARSAAEADSPPGPAPHAREASPPDATAIAAGPRADAAERAEISGVVLGPDGRPPTVAYVKYVWTDRGRMREVHTQTQRDGRFVLALDDPRARGDLLAHVHRHRLAPAARTGVDAGASGVELRLGEPAYFRVEALADGVPIAASPTFYWQLDGHSIQDWPGGVDGGDRSSWAPSPVPFRVYLNVRGGTGGWFGPFEPAAVGPRLELEVEAYPRVSGRVTRGGEPLAGVRVSLRPASASGSATPAAWRGSDVETDAHGRFELVYRDAGRYEAHAFSPTEGEGRAGPLELDGEDRVGVDVELSSGPATIEGRVLFPSGHGPDEVWLTVTSGDGYRALRDDGTFTLPGLSAGAQRIRVLRGYGRDPDSHGEPGESWIWMTHGPSGPPEWLDHARVYEVDLAPAGRAWLEIDLAAPLACRLEGSVLVDGAAPELRAPRRDPYGAFDSQPVRIDRGERTDDDSAAELGADGRFALGTCSPGERRLVVDVAFADSDETYWVVRDRVELLPGRVEWSLDVDTGRVLVLPQDEERPVWAAPLARWRGPGGAEIVVHGARLDERRGTQLYSRVPAGTVRLESRGSVVECEVRAGETTEVRWPPP